MNAKTLLSWAAALAVAAAAVPAWGQCHGGYGGYYAAPAITYAVPAHCYPSAGYVHVLCPRLRQFELRLELWLLLGQLQLRPARAAVLHRLAL